MDGKPIDVVLSYQQLHEAARHIENRAWTALNNFLVANTILLAVWVQLSVAPEPSVNADTRRYVLLALSLLGYLSGVSWGLLGSRNYVHIAQFGRRANELETSYSEVGERWRVMSVTRTVQSQVAFPIKSKFLDRPIGFLRAMSYQPWLMCLTPLILSALYLFLVQIAVGFYPPAWLGISWTFALMIWAASLSWVFYQSSDWSPFATERS